MFYDIRIENIGKNEFAALYVAQHPGALDICLPVKRVLTSKEDGHVQVRGWWLEADSNGWTWVRSPASLVPPWESKRRHKSRIKSKRSRSK